MGPTCQVHLVLLYNNLKKPAVFLSANHLVCYCIQMSLASAEDMQRCYFLQPNLYLAARILNQNTDSLLSPAGSIYELKIEEDNKAIDVNIVHTNDATKQQRKRLIDILIRYKILFSSHTWSVGELESILYTSGLKLASLPHNNGSFQCRGKSNYNVQKSSSASSNLVCWSRTIPRHGDPIFSFL